MKSIIKEALIVFLLCIAICLILWIIFYNYLPNNMVVPSNVEAYSTSSTVKNEIKESVAEYPKQNVVFEVTDSDLSAYKKSQSFAQGKSDPFSMSESSTPSDSKSEGSTSDKAQSTDSGKSSNDEKNSSNSGDSSKNDSNNGTFFEDTKLK